MATGSHEQQKKAVGSDKHNNLIYRQEASLPRLACRALDILDSNVECRVQAIVPLCGARLFYIDLMLLLLLLQIDDKRFFLYLGASSDCDETSGRLSIGFGRIGDDKINKGNLLNCGRHIAGKILSSLNKSTFSSYYPIRFRKKTSHDNRAPIYGKQQQQQQTTTKTRGRESRIAICKLQFAICNCNNEP